MRYAYVLEASAWIVVGLILGLLVVTLIERAARRTAARRR